MPPHLPSALTTQIFPKPGELGQTEANLGNKMQGDDWGRSKSASISSPRAVQARSF